MTDEERETTNGERETTNREMTNGEREASGWEVSNEQEMEEQAMEEELENDSVAASLTPPRTGVAAQAGHLAGGAVRVTGSALSGLGRAIVPAAPPPDGFSGEAPERADPAADDLDDLFDGPEPEDNDMAIDHLVSMSDEDMDDVVGAPEEEDMDDLLDVSMEDVMGEAPPPRVRATGRVYIPRRPPPAGMGGML